MILEHYSKGPLAWPPRDYVQTNHKEGWGHPPKPEGLWVSVKGGDPDWPEWCESEDFRLEHLAVCTRVILADNANIRIVNGEAELATFDEQYGTDYAYGYGSSVAHRRIDWIKLAEDYDGLIIAPYVWACRLPWRTDEPTHRYRISDWYYPWDCASGVIWKARAIAAFEPQMEEKAA